VKDFKKIDETSDIIQCVLRARLHPCPLETLLGERGDVVFLIEVLQKDAGSVTSGSAHRADPTGAAYPWSHAKALRFLGFGVQAT
jgi:hypothetical protein